MCARLNRVMEEGAHQSAFRVHKLSIGNISSNCVVVVDVVVAVVVAVVDVETWHLGPLEKGFTRKH